MSNPTDEAYLPNWIIILFYAIGIFVGATAGILFISLIRTTTLTLAISGCVAGTIFVMAIAITTLAMQWANQKDFYINEFGWFATALVVGSLVALITVDKNGNVAATGFVAGIALMSIALLVAGWINVNLHLGIFPLSIVFVNLIVAIITFFITLVLKWAILAIYLLVLNGPDSQTSIVVVCLIFKYLGESG
jgi:hypothetical protein